MAPCRQSVHNQRASCAFLLCRDFVMNWVQHARAAGVHNFAIGGCCSPFRPIMPAALLCLLSAAPNLWAAGAMDELLLKYLQAQEVPTYLTRINVAPTDLNYRKPGFNLLVGWQAF